MVWEETIIFLPKEVRLERGVVCAMQSKPFLCRLCAWQVAGVLQ